MKILRVIASMDPASGGPCQGIRNSIPALESLGARNEVVCLDSPAAAYLNKDPFAIHAVGPAHGPWQSSPKLVPFLINNLSRFDVVIVHGLWLFHGYAVRKAFNSYRKLNKRAGIPKLYVMPHGMLDPYFQKAGGRKLKAARNWLYWKLIESKLVKAADGLLFTCEAELLLARIPFRPYRPKKEINVGYGIAKPPGINHWLISEFRKKCKALDDAPYFLFLSRIHEKKGVDLLIDAYASCLEAAIEESKKNGSEPSFTTFPKLVIAGPGLESGYGEMIIKKVKEQSILQDRVLFPGMLTGDAKWGAFYGCEAFLLPSHQENFGIAVAEALACSKPVLISNQVNIWREIETDNAGLIAPDTLQGTYDLISHFQDTGAAVKTQMAINALACYERNFTIGAASSKLFSALKN